MPGNGNKEPMNGQMQSIGTAPARRSVASNSSMALRPGRVVIIASGSGGWAGGCVVCVSKNKIFSFFSNCSFYIMYIDKKRERSKFRMVVGGRY